MPKEKDNPADIAKGIKKVREFHKLGKVSLRKHGHSMKYSHMAGAAEEMGVSEEHLRKARVAANAENGYLPEELGELEEQCREHGFAPGPTFVIRLLSVGKGKKRTVLQANAVEQRWSLDELETEIARQRHGDNRRKRGRRRRIPETVPDTLFRLQLMCNRWTRWETALGDEFDPEEDGTKKCMDYDLPSSVQRQLTSTTKEIKKLHDIVVEALKRPKPKRKAR